MMKGGRFRIPFIYVIIGILWVTLSDKAILWLADKVNYRLAGQVSMGKGIFFILFTGILLYLLIAEEREKDIKLKLALERYHIVSRATGQVIYEVDMVLDLVIFNEQISSFTQIPLEGAGESVNWWQSRIHPDDLPAVLALQQQGIAQRKEHWQAEYRILTRDGEYKYVHDQGFLVFDESGRPIRIIGAIKDIDLLKRNTEEINRMEEILNKIYNPVMISSPEGLITWINPAFAEQTEYSAEDAIGKRYADLLYGPKTDRAITQQLLDAVHSGEAFSTELINYTKSKKEMWVSMYVSPIFNTKGELECYISIRNDLTEHKEKEAEIVRQHKQLKVVSWLNSHQIRKPVASILALTELIKSSDNDREKDELLEMLYLSTVELDNIVRRINAEASGDTEQPGLQAAVS